MSKRQRLNVTVYRHQNGHWSVYMTLPDGATESWRGVLDVRNVDGFIWKRLTEMAARLDGSSE